MRKIDDNIKEKRLAKNNKVKAGEQKATAVIAKITNQKGKFKKVSNPVRNYGYRQTFVPPEYDLAKISLLEDGESYVRQAFKKKTALMFKEGEVFTGKNDKTIEYLKARIKQMEYVTNIPWRTLLRETGKELIAKSNYFWVKVRNEKASGGKSMDGTTVPVAGYFGMPAETVKVKKNKNGKVIKYRQEMPDGRWKEYSPKDVIHFAFNRKPGFVFGTPEIIPVIPDIQALRRLEENVEVLLYQTLFPIFQYKVGTPEKPAGDIVLEDGTRMNEVDYVKMQIANMPTEGGIVTPERHEIKYVGANGEIPKYRDALDYFKQRVLAGLGISSLDIGDGDSSTRSTADSLSKALIDSVKDYQGVFEQVINSQVIPELLLESPFRFDVLTTDHVVEMKFKEIDIEEQMKKNVNAQLQYNSELIDIDEAREILGRQPLAEAQEEKMFMERSTMKVLKEEQAGTMELAKESAKQTAQAGASANGDKKKAAANSVKTASRPTNQHGTKTGPQKSRKDRWIRSEMRLLKNFKDAVSNDDLMEDMIVAAQLRLNKKAALLDSEEKNNFLDKVTVELSSLL